MANKTVLMVAFHFPPAAMGSGHLRTLGFARYLPASGWNPIILSARALAYPRTAPIDAGVVPPGCRVHRALAFDAGRQLAIAGKYPGFMAQPDRWATWWPAAVWQGLGLIRRYHVDAVWSTYPIMTAHCIGRTLSRMAGVPWIADFRDPVAGSVGAANPWAAASQRRWERRVLNTADRIVFTTPGALQDYAERYPAVHDDGRLAVIENGYDEAAFADLPAPETRSANQPLRLLHSGLLYRDGRDPLPFFEALARLKAAGKINPGDVHVMLRASGSEAVYAREIDRLGIRDLVTLGPRVSNRDALLEQAAADALLLFQGSRFNRQIPAKLYEYLRIGRPIFALVDAHGDTAGTLENTGGADVAPIGDAGAIAARLSMFIDALRAGHAATARPDAVARHSRRKGAATLATLLKQLVTPIPAARGVPSANPDATAPDTFNDARAAQHQLDDHGEKKHELES